MATRHLFQKPPRPSTTFLDLVGQGLTTGKSQSSRPGLEESDWLYWLWQSLAKCFLAFPDLPWSLYSMEHCDRRRRSTQPFQQPRPWDFCALGSALDLDFESQVTGLQRKLCLSYLGNSLNKAFADVYLRGEVQKCSFCYWHFMPFCSTWRSWIRWCIGRSPWSTNRTEKLLSLSSSCPRPWRWVVALTLKMSQHVSTCLNMSQHVSHHFSSFWNHVTTTRVLDTCNIL